MTTFQEILGIKHPIIGGPMYPCSNPELIAAVSNAGGIGIVQPISLTFVHKYELRQGLRYIRTLTDKPIGFNALIEKSSSRYQKKMEEWIEIALEENVRFFITSLGNPEWIVKRVSKVGGIVYHDVTEKKWAEKGLAAGASGLIAVNNRAGGHAGSKTKENLLEELKEFKVPLICAGGIGDKAQYQEALKIGYQGAQLGTRFIASLECKASDAYKNAIINATEEDIVLSEKITGVPVSIIKNFATQNIGTKANNFTKFLLNNPSSKHLVRTIYTLLSIFRLKKSLMSNKTNEIWQAGKSVSGISEIKSVLDIIEDLTN